jgi:hypothetical protein
VIIIGRSAKYDGEDYAPLLYRRPRLKVLAIADTGKTACLHELRPRRTSLGEISAHKLASAIRGGEQGTSSRAAVRKKPAKVG